MVLADHFKGCLRDRSNAVKVKILGKLCHCIVICSVDRDLGVEKEDAACINAESEGTHLVSGRNREWDWVYCEEVQEGTA